MATLTTIIQFTNRWENQNVTDGQEMSANSGEDMCQKTGSYFHNYSIDCHWLMMIWALPEVARMILL
jgi:hypothetical protein